MFANAALDHEQAEQAVIASPLITDSPNFCFEFYYDIKPFEGISSLQILMEKPDVKEEIVIWQLSNSKLDFWEQGRVHIANPDDFYILIKAIRTNKPEGYAAIDDITIVPNDECQIYPAEAQPPPPPPATQCDFEDGLCGWWGNSHFMFNRTTGHKLADAGLEGPLFDHNDSQESMCLII